MSQFPIAAPPALSVVSSLSAVARSNPSLTGTGGSAVWPLANLAIFMPFELETPFLVSKLWWANGATVAGNVDCGVYTRDGTKLVSTGSTAQATSNAVQSVAVTSILLLPDSYYFALSASNVGGAFYQPTTSVSAQLASMGIAEQAAAVPLPATFTLATTTRTRFPICGMLAASPGVI